MPLQLIQASFERSQKDEVRSGACFARHVVRHEQPGCRQVHAVIYIVPRGGAAGEVEHDKIAFVFGFSLVCPDDGVFHVQAFV